MGDTQLSATVTQSESHQVMTLEAVHNQIQLIQQLMKNEMVNGEHYGIVPGCGDKKVLLKAGAEKINMMFRMAPKFDIKIIEFPGGHREYQIRTSIYHIDSGKFLGEGVGSCSTLESKYRWRDGKRKCPACEQEAIIKGKEEYGGGWVCFTKKGGCGAKFVDKEPKILEQQTGRVENTDIADVYNTCLKMGKKRSHVDATLSATAASDIFTQDIEENAEPDVVTEAKKDDASKGTVKKPEPAKSKPVSVPPADAKLTPGQQKTFELKLAEMMADPDEVKLFIESKFKKKIEEVTFSEAQIVLRTWKDGGEPPEEKQGEKK